MKIKTTKSVEIEVEIIFPYYTKSIAGHMRFDDENHCVYVRGEGIDVKNSYPNEWLTDEPATQDEFDAAFKNTFNLINQLIPLKSSTMTKEAIELYGVKMLTKHTYYEESGDGITDEFTPASNELDGIEIGGVECMHIINQDIIEEIEISINKEL